MSLAQRDRALRFIASGSSAAKQLRENFRTSDSTVSFGQAIASASTRASSTDSGDLNNEKQPVTYSLLMKIPYASDAGNFLKGLYLFFNSPKLDLADMKPLAFSLTSANYRLEECARQVTDQGGRLITLDEADSFGARRENARAASDPFKRMRALDEVSLDERSFVREIDYLYVDGVNPDEPYRGLREDVFTARYFYGGCLQHVEEKSLGNEIMATVAISKYLKVPSLSESRIGVVSGFAVKWLNKLSRQRPSQFTGTDGRLVSDATRGDMIQIVPIRCERRYPRHCSNAEGVPNEHDLDAVVERRVEQRVHAVAADGRVRHIIPESEDDAYDEDEEEGGGGGARRPRFGLVYQAYTYGVFIPIGTTTKTFAHPVESTRISARRNPRDYMACNATFGVDMQLGLV